MGPVNRNPPESRLFGDTPADLAWSTETAPLGDEREKDSRVRAGCSTVGSARTAVSSSARTQALRLPGPKADVCSISGKLICEDSKTASLEASARLNNPDGDCTKASNFKNRKCAALSPYRFPGERGVGESPSKGSEMTRVNKSTAS